MSKAKLSRIIFLLAAIQAMPVQVHAKPIIFPMHGLMVASKKPVPIEMDWDDNNFINANPKVYNHKIARLAAIFSTIAYVHADERPNTNELLKSYRLLGFNESNIYWNYNLDYNHPMNQNNQAAYSFAFKDIQTPSGTKKLVFLIIRGTPLSANEWLSNLNISDSTKKDIKVHEGFLSTCEIIKQDFYKFLQDNAISKSDSYFLISGHSRGAAIANLLGSIFYDDKVITSDKMFVYTFASPNVSQEDRTQNDEYKFIWNIVNAEDAVPTVPPNRNKWNWKKFGNTRVIANYWNSDPETYLNDYLPRMNKYYKKLLLREYAPFKSGPFFQSQASRILTGYTPDVKTYYRFGLHFISATALKLAFRSEPKSENIISEEDSQAQGITASESSQQSAESAESEEKAEAMQLPFVLRPIQSYVNNHTDNGFDYALNAAVDMHACEAYLSWMLALEENEIFASLGSSQIVIDGALDCAIYDDDGNMLARIVNGMPEIFTITPPVGIMPLPYKNVLGFPGNKNLNIIVHKDSLIPTIVGYKIEHYDAAGTLLERSEKSHFYPHTNLSVKFSAGKSTLEENQLTFEKLSRKEAKPLVKKYKLNDNFKFRIQPEIEATFGSTFAMGARIGAPVFYGTVLGELRSTKSYGLASGIGHQHILYGRVLFDSELFARYLWTKNDEDKKVFDIVPQARFTLAYKPLRRAHYFAGVVFDMNIDGFNDTAFSTSARKSYFSKIRLNEKLSLQPAIQIGARF
ncbi:lipase family protein [uncultured Treponema sp.]|uniref:lipase family protein n=1 Tax=uncultured Treponema sp. TaxID=162155 RepID=UPI0025D98E4B|nr:lipase family protein [uncultured Treponema sp.]